MGNITDTRRIMFVWKYVTLTIELSMRMNSQYGISFSVKEKIFLI